MKGKPTLELVSQSQEYFYALVVDVLKKTALKTKPETEFYLVNLLSEFVLSNRLYLQDSEGHYRDEPLAMLLKDAVEEKQTSAKRLLYRQIGDISLYRAGFFPDSISQKAVSLSYYIDMGSNAYQSVAAIADEDSLKPTYEELGERFSKFVDVISLVSERTALPKNETDLLKLYERWMNTGSERAEKALRDAGIITVPATNPKKNEQQ